MRDSYVSADLRHLAQLRQVELVALAVQQRAQRAASARRVVGEKPLGEVREALACRARPQSSQKRRWEAGGRWWEAVGGGGR